MMLRCYAINTNYMQARVGCLSDAALIKTIANSEQKKRQVPSTTINLTDSFKLKYTLLHAGTCGW